MVRLSTCLFTLMCLPGLSPAQEWRPISASPTDTTGITLGKPRSSRPQENPALQALPAPPTSSVVIHQASRPADMESPAAPTFGSATTLFRTGYQQPMTPEEQFNCGVVPGASSQPGWFGSGGGSTQPPPPAGWSTGPAPGGAPPPGGHPWYQGIKDCWNRVCNPGAGGQGLFGGWDARSDHAFDSFISPVTNPTYFEDPRSLTEWRPIFIYQKAPSDNPLLAGGSMFVFNLQGRISINDRWSIILHRLGFASVDPGDGALGGFGGGTGLTDLQIGTKYTFYRDDRSNTLAAVGVSFDIPIGSNDVLSGTGAAMTPYLSFGQAFGNWHFLASTGYRWGFSDSTSDFFFLSAHIDYSFFNRFYPLAEINWYRYTSSGDTWPVNFEGGDLFNIGATGANGINLVTMGLGFRYKFTEALQLGAVYEFPVTGSDGLEKYRIMFDLIFRY